MKSNIPMVIMLVIGFSVGQMSATLFTINPWILSLFVLGLGLALGYISRQQQTKF